MVTNLSDAQLGLTAHADPEPDHVPKRILITGAAGFLGRNLGGWLRQHGNIVFGIDCNLPPDSARIDYVERMDYGDVRDRMHIESVIRRIQPEVVYHFAGQAYVKASFDDPSGTYNTNVIGTLNVLEALRHQKIPGCVLVHAGSGTQYGNSTEENGSTEDSAFGPTSPYASSKCAADILCQQYATSFDMPIYRLRIFGTTGRGKTGDFVHDFLSQIRTRKARGDRNPIRVGNLDAQRDLIDVRDAIRAFVCVAESNAPGAYNISSGSAIRIQALMMRMLETFGQGLETEMDPTRMRPAEESIHHGSNKKLRALGWRRQYDLDRTLSWVAAEFGL